MHNYILQYIHTVSHKQANVLHIQCFLTIIQFMGIHGEEYVIQVAKAQYNYINVLSVTTLASNQGFQLGLPEHIIPGIC